MTVDENDAEIGPDPGGGTPADDAKRHVERINELSAIARTSWLGLLAYLGFIGVTLLAVEDADFFVPTRQTELPLVGVAIPTFSFFLLAPILGAALYVYLHIHLLKLWDATAAAPPEIEGEPLGERLHPWIANDFALARKHPRALRPRPLRAIGHAATWLLVWTAGPTVLFFFWWWSMPAHAEGLTLALGAALLAALHAGSVSWWCVRAWLPETERRAAPWGPAWRRGAAGTVAIVVIVVSWLRTEAGFDLYANRAIDLYEARFGPVFTDGSFVNGDLKPAQEVQEQWVTAHSLIPKLEWFTLTSDNPVFGRWIDPVFGWSPLASTAVETVEMVDVPPDWRTPETARHIFRASWCAREGLTMLICDHPKSADRPASSAQQADRTAWCAERGLSQVEGACATYFDSLDRRFEAFWTEERLAARADLSKLDLSARDLRSASAARVTLVGANLSWARLDGADFGEARLEGANLFEARLDGANLSEARLEEADLSGARLEGANLSEARLDGANLSEARLDGANLNQARLDGANLWGARLDGAILWGARLEGADLNEARLQVTHLLRARLEGADLSWARLEGANLWQADFRNANWTGTSNQTSLAQFADLRTSRELAQSQLENLIGNVETLLPDHLNENGERYYVWSCWETPPPGFDALVERTARFSGGESVRADLRRLFLCGHRPRRKTGTPLALDAPYPEGHPLAGRN